MKRSSFLQKSTLCLNILHNFLPHIKFKIKNMQKSKKNPKNQPLNMVIHIQIQAENIVIRSTEALHLSKE